MARLLDLLATACIAGALLSIMSGLTAASHGNSSISPDKAIYSPCDKVNISLMLADLRADKYRYEWNRTMAGNMFAYSGRIASDGDYLYTTAANGRQSRGNVLTIKTDLNGTEVWNRTWGLTDEDFPINLILDNDRICIVGASGDGAWPDPLFLLAYDKNGNELWNMTWAGGDMNWATGLVAVRDALFISGWSWNTSATIDAVLLKFNLTNRDFEWSRSWDVGSDEYGEDITYLAGSLYMALFDSAGTGYAGLIKYDLDGREVWNRTWGPGWDTYAICSDGKDILLAGSRKENGTYASYLRIFSERGDLLTERFFGESPNINHFSSVRTMNGIAYCVGNFMKSQSPDSRDAFFVAYETRNWSMIMNYTWGGGDEEICNGVAVVGGSEVYCSGGTRSFNNGSWQLFLLKYTNRLSNSAIPVGIQVKGPDGKVYHNDTGNTDTNGNAGASFSLPTDAPEGRYECSVTADICGTALVNRTYFDVAWPWSPVLTSDSPSAIMSCQPGDTLSLRAYAGYEYPPANGKKSAAETAVSADLLFPNGTLYMTVANATGPSGWANFSLALPKSTPSGNYTIRFRGFEGLGRELHLIVLTPAGGRASVGQSALPIPLTPVLGSASVGLIVIGLVIAGTETAKFAFFAPIAPLYTRIRRDKALSHRVRHLIIGYLADNPGQHYNALKKALKLSNSVMVYHLLVLEREGFIKSQRDGTMKRFYPISIKTPETRKRTPEELDAAILAAVEQRPGMTHKDLMEHLVVGNDVVKYHTRKLVRARRLLSSKDGKMRVYFPLKK